MMRSKTMLGGLAAAAVLATGSAALAADGDVVRYSISLNNVDYFFSNGLHGNPANTLLLSVIDPAAAGGAVVDFGWDDLVIDVHANQAVENWASELRLGYTWDEYAGIEWKQPFPGANTDGLHGPVSADGQHFVGDTINSDGAIELWARSTWDDSTGLPAGTLLSGNVWIDVKHIPAPGALALLGAAGLVGSRRRRRA